MSANLTLNLKTVNDATALADMLGLSGRPSTAPRYMSESGKPLARMAEDACEGEEIDKNVFSRSRRVSIGDDVLWPSQATMAFNMMKAGHIRRSKSAQATGVDLSKFADVTAFRQALCDDDAEKLARAITPASIDEAPHLFLVSELILTLPGIIEVERAIPTARDIFPFRFLNAPGAEYYRLNVMSDTGDAQWTKNFDGTPPVVGSDRNQITRPLEYLWMMARWGMRELMQWQMARDNGTTLPDFARWRPLRAREALLRQENLWVWFGGPTGSQIHGALSSQNGINITNSANWVDLTPAQNVAVITDAITRITDTGVEVPNLIVMGFAQYNYFATAQWPNTEKMILSVLTDNLRPLGITEIIAVPEMTYRAALQAKFVAKGYDAATATRYAGGVGGLDAMLVMSRRTEKIAGICHQDVRSLPPDVISTETTAVQILGSGGCEVRYPQAHEIVTFDAPLP